MNRASMFCSACAVRSLRFLIRISVSRSASSVKRLHFSSVRLFLLGMICQVDDWEVMGHLSE